MTKKFDLSTNSSGSKETFDTVIVSKSIKNTSNGELHQNGEINALENESNNKPNEKDEKRKRGEVASIREVFRFADSKDRLLMFGGMVTSILHGIALPLMSIVYGSMTDLFVDSSYLENILNLIMPNITEKFPNATTEKIIDNIGTIIDYLYANNYTEEAQRLEEALPGDIVEQMRIYSFFYIGIGVAVIALGYGQMCFWQMTSHRQSHRIRNRLFRSILRQNIGWFDTQQPTQLTSRLTDDITVIQEGMAEKIAIFLQLMASFVGGFVIAFIYGWQMTLIMVTVTPLLIITGAITSRMMAAFAKGQLQAYAKAGGVAEEVISSVRTVQAFGGEQKEINRYTQNLIDAKNFGLRKAAASGLGFGSVFISMYGVIAFGFWYGSTLVMDPDKNYSAGDVMIVYLNVTFGTFSLGNAIPYIENFSDARGAAYTIFKIIDRVPPIDSISSAGLQPPKFTGNVEFRNVKFRYPSRNDVQVLNGLSLKINVGQTVAIVGASGCGKSTCIQLLQRFYDVLDGQVIVDGVDIRELNLKWLRQNIGVVSQEPILFSTTIAENIRYGRMDVTQKEIEMAAREANAHDFITSLTKGYDTMVGERGAQLSGGQKQRIAIARALVRNPKILLLDEATSALDNESEALVQVALDKARLGRTTVVVAHRLSTIRTADVIVGVENGVVRETGTHEQLMAQRGLYYQLVTNQTAGPQVQSDAEDDGIYEDVLDKKKMANDEKIQFNRLRSVSSGRLSSVITSEDNSEKTDVKKTENDIIRLMKMNSPEWPWLLLACIFTVIWGCIQPAYSILFGRFLGVFSLLDQDEMRSKANAFSVAIFILGIIAAIAIFCTIYGISRAGEYLTMRLRQRVFDSILHQSAEFFDDNANSTGALCARLSKDASDVHAAGGQRLALLMRTMATIAVSLALAFILSWQLALVSVVFAPFMLISGYIRIKSRYGAKTSKDESESVQRSGKVASESVSNVRTIAALTIEDNLCQQYETLTSEFNRKEVRLSHMYGFTYGFAQSVVYFSYAACYYVGALLVDSNQLEYENMFTVLQCVIIGSMLLGQTGAMILDYGKGKQAIARIFKILDDIPTINIDINVGKQLNDFNGTAHFNSVSFNYPTRPDIAVLRGLDLSVMAGKRIALVGTSGCGKSTTIQLLERFYDPNQGKVMTEKVDIKNLHLTWVRNQMGIVSQEPILFDYSIRDNIAYGDNSRQVSMNEIIEAAKMANIHNFVTSLPQGYDTRVGDKGTQLSGGQKQRIAIARALIRNPKILLLDEATSSLDSESEKIVQEALDKAQEGRTCIVIAHRLSTIQNADCICVIRQGVVAEMGSHADLLAQKGIYYKLHNAQLKSKEQD